MRSKLKVVENTAEIRKLEIEKMEKDARALRSQLLDYHDKIKEQQELLDKKRLELEVSKQSNNTQKESINQLMERLETNLKQFREDEEKRNTMMRKLRKSESEKAILNQKFIELKEKMDKTEELLKVQNVRLHRKQSEVSNLERRMTLLHIEAGLKSDFKDAEIVEDLMSDAGMSTPTITPMKGKSMRGRKSAHSTRTATRQEISSTRSPRAKLDFAMESSTFGDLNEEEPNSTRAVQATRVAGERNPLLPREPLAGERRITSMYVRSRDTNTHKQEKEEHSLFFAFLCCRGRENSTS
eukprot:CAMPEP_0167769050 /NCGR_PEP_ID=MMETSP0110_2-20121227/17064_1 /TAXON_ID=629695 /ORGANISM="Gymnochlora sp., Strain CCMP2014" /LENGTH=297 /DNA_ID=CAMNT_0007657905 /DNA_START=333 /DNA_END=1227 /DNA_ORIENTATION=+